MYCAMFDNFGLARVLIEDYGANPSIKNKVGQRYKALDLA